MNTSLFSKLKIYAMFGIITISVPFGWATASGGGAVSANISNATTAPAVNAPAGANTSLNWAGYEATGGTYTAISGTWTVPNVVAATSTGTQADATWVGIGGVTSHDLIQAGTQGVTSPNGTVAYSAWYETLPQATTPFSLTVNAGDSVTASINETATSQWQIIFRDNTTGQSATENVTYNSSLSSAEWIEEMPSDGVRMIPLDSFGTISFTGGMATVSGVSETISGASGAPITMITQNNQTLAAPSSLGADGESFTVTRSSLAATSGGSGVTYITLPGGGRGTGWRTGVGPRGFTRHWRTTSTSTPSGAVTTTGASGYGTYGNGGSASGYGTPATTVTVGNATSVQLQIQNLESQLQALLQQFQTSQSFRMRGTRNGWMR